MTEEDIKHLIDKFSADNPLLVNMHKDYSGVFFSKLKTIQGVSAKKIEQLLCCNSQFSTFGYNQGIAELFLYFLICKRGIEFTCEKKQNSSNGTNVDVVLEQNGVTFNFEVKSPEYKIAESNVIHGSFANRFGDNDANIAYMKDLIEEMKSGLENTPYDDIKSDDLTDNKVKTSLLSAQSKFPEPSETNCNILFICTTTSEMIAYWRYIVNAQSGFFHEKSNVSCFLTKKDGIPLKKEMYDKVSAIILSNAITLNERRIRDSWDLENSINIVLMNPFCKTQCFGHYQTLDDFFPHRTQEFARGLMEFKNNHGDIPEECFMYDFVSKNGYGFNEEKTK